MDTSTPVGSMVFTVIAALAQMELEIKRERVLDSVSKRRAAGSDPGGRPRKISESQLKNLAHDCRLLWFAVDGERLVATQHRDSRGGNLPRDINVRASGARTRISTFLAGVFLLVLVLALGDVVAIIPMAALVAVMIVVSIATFDWHSITSATLKRMPKSELAVMLITVIATVWTHNLAIGVVLGVLVAMVLFARRVAHFTNVTRRIVGDTAHYDVEGELFFASSNDLTTQFEYTADPDRIVIDMSRSHIWDASTVTALDAVVTKYKSNDKSVHIEGMNDATTAFHQRLSGEVASSH